MSDVAIRVENLSKLYRIGPRERYKALRDTLTDAMYAPFRRSRSTFQRANVQRSNDNYIWALKDVSFEVKRGEVVGIIGRNGAGKTTLLKILSRITEPTEGYAEIHGRVGSLLEVGTGFHPELTGRENIYLSGAILGMKKAEIDRKFDEIVAFAEVEKFIDTPVKHYSSGMYVRLAFAVAAHLEPEILLVDEVLAVGDAAFQKKCLGKMGDVAKEGRTVLFVSHNMGAIQNLCESSYLLDRGRVIASGPTNQVIRRYMETAKVGTAISLCERSDRKGNGRLKFTDIVLQDIHGNLIEDAQSGKDLIISIGYVSNEDRPLKNVSVSIGIYDLFGQFLTLLENEMAGTVFDEIPSRGGIVCRIPRLPLSPGSYELNLYCEVNGIVADWIQSAGRLSVLDGDFFGTGKLPPPSHRGFLLNHSWNIVEE